MLWLIGLGVAAVVLFAASGKAGEGSAPSRGQTSGSGWSILLQGPAMLPGDKQTLVTLANQLGIYNMGLAKLDSPQPGYMVFTVVSDDVMPEVGKHISMNGIPFTVVQVQPAPI